MSFSASSTLSAGSKEARYSDTPALRAISPATSLLSPVNITVRAPISFNCFMTDGVSSLSSSAMVTEPANCPSCATYTTVPTLSDFTKVMPNSFISFSFPQRISVAPFVARTPLPEISVTVNPSHLSHSVSPSQTWFLYSEIIDRAMGWEEPCSAILASSSISFLRSAGDTSTTAKLPLVRVPVLSNTNMFALSNLSR